MSRARYCGSFMLFSIVLSGLLCCFLFLNNLHAFSTRFIYDLWSARDGGQKLQAVESESLPGLLLEFYAENGLDGRGTISAGTKKYGHAHTSNAQ